GRSIPAEAVRVVGQVADETPVKGALQLAGVLANPALLEAVGVQPDPTTGERWLENQAERWVPGAGLLRAGANALDPLERQIAGASLPEKMVRAVESEIPELRNTLPPRLDQTGQVRPNPKSGPNALNPLAERQETQNPVLRLLDANGVAISSSMPHVDGPDEEPWTAGQLDLYHQRLGRLVEQHVLATVGGPDRLRQVKDQPATPQTRQAVAAAVDRAKKQLYQDPDFVAQIARSEEHT